MIKSSKTIRTCSAIMILSVTLVIFMISDIRQRPLSATQRRFVRSIKNITSNQTNEKPNEKPTDKEVWIASTISVSIISAVGLLGVAVVPLVQKVFYNKIIQYLVALAVGTLTGDAFLHLIPHAIKGAHEDKDGHDEETTTVMKGLAALGGVYFFFMAEKFLSMMSDYRAEKRAEEEERQRQLQDPRRSELRRLSAMQLNLNNSSNRRGSHLPNSRDSAMFRRLSKVNPADDDDDGILMTGLSSRAMKSIDNLRRFSELDTEEDLSGLNKRFQCSVTGGLLAVPGYATYNSPSDDEQEENTGGEISLMVPSPDYKPHIQTIDENKNDLNSNLRVKIVDNKDDKKQSKDAAVNEKEEKKGGHGHGHSHEVPGSIASVAWMVILGDGLHNFSDGLAIGAAFGVKISGGISTAVAVFCHELPHELGDFAVLLKTGMKIRQALFYNVVSSILCFLGMMIGIALKDVANANYWIFAITAGTFIYIALVDMLPELNSAEVRPGESRILHFCIQNLGLLSGVGLMFLIARYEGDIKEKLSCSKKNCY